MVYPEILLERLTIAGLRADMYTRDLQNTSSSLQTSISNFCSRKQSLFTPRIIQNLQKRSEELLMVKAAGIYNCQSASKC
jgi:hypothetical protein